MDFSLIETMRWEPDNGFIRLDLHLARLKASAQALGFEGADQANASLEEFAKEQLGSGQISPLEVGGEAHSRKRMKSIQRIDFSDDVSALPAEGGEGFPPRERYCENVEVAHPPLSPLATSPPQGGRSTETQSSDRVRLELFPDGKINITSAPFQLQSKDTIWSVRIATTRLSSQDTLLHHKTSKRSLYDQARAEFSKEDADEVLLLNEKGEMCEGTITSVFVDDGTGILLTPPLSCGLLAGVLRTSLLCSKKVRVQKLTASDLDGKALYVGNSLRGLIRARLN